MKSEKDLKDVLAEHQAKAVLVKELLLKDNDCGVAKENRVKAAKLLEGVAHLDPKTCKNLLKLEKSLELNDTKALLKSGMLFTESDFRKVAQNIREAAAMLKNWPLKLCIIVSNIGHGCCVWRIHEAQKAKYSMSLV